MAYNRVGGWFWIKGPAISWEIPVMLSTSWTVSCLVTCTMNMPGAAPSSDVHFKSRTYLSLPRREVTGVLPTRQFSYQSSKRILVFNETRAHKPNWWQKEERDESKYPRPLALSSSRQLVGWSLLQSVAGCFCVWWTVGHLGNRTRCFIGAF